MTTLEIGVVYTLNPFGSRVLILFLFALAFARKSLSLWSLWLLFEQKSDHLLQIVDRLLQALKHVILFPLHSILLFKLSGQLFKSIGHVCEGCSLRAEI